MEEIIIYTDGGCSGNPGPGGWAAAIIFNDKEKQLSGGEKFTTNNKMELIAAIKALEFVKSDPDLAAKKILVNIDSQYVKRGITEWITNWKKRDWQTSEKTPVKNKELWQELDELNAALDISWNWVKGHAGVKYNEICDSLCRQEISKQKN